MINYDELGVRARCVHQIMQGNGRCDPFVRFYGYTHGKVSWNSRDHHHKKKCSQDYVFHFRVQPQDGIIMEMEKVFMPGACLLQIFGFDGQSFKILRRFQDDFFTLYQTHVAPLMWRQNEIHITATPFSNKDCEFKLNYTSRSAQSIPPEVSKKVLLREYEGSSLHEYYCNNITKLPEVSTCDGVRHCVGGEDEAGCDYLRQGCSEGWYPSNDICVKVVVAKHGKILVTGREGAEPAAQHRCREDHGGATLAHLLHLSDVDTAARMLLKAGAMDAQVWLSPVTAVAPWCRHLYRFQWQWGGHGGPVAHEHQRLQRTWTQTPPSCAVLVVKTTRQHKLQPGVWYTGDPIESEQQGKRNVFSNLCFHRSDLQPSGYICTKPNPTRPARRLTLPAISFPAPKTPMSKFPTKACHDGSRVHPFYRCPWGEEEGAEDEVEEKEGTEEREEEEEKEGAGKAGEGGRGGGGLKRGDNQDGPTPPPPPRRFPLSPCRYGPGVHFTLLCDGNADCVDGSDEQDCAQPRFSPLVQSSFVCRNKMVVLKDSRCTAHEECKDGSDEEDCYSCHNQNLTVCGSTGCLPLLYIHFISSCPPSRDSKTDVSEIRRDTPEFDPRYTWRLDLDGQGMSLLARVQGDKDRDGAEGRDGGCGEGHLRCDGGLCLPSFLVGNGEQDCPRGEDEGVAARNVTCPGYYRCHDSAICVHPDRLCDKFSHCPNKDDETYCHHPCPHNCQCQGLAAACSAMVDPLQMIHLRYLDLSHASGVFVDRFHVMEYLSHLNASFCALRNASLGDMPKLRTLDLSHNALSGVASLRLRALTGLAFLDLSHNPLAPAMGAAFRSLLMSAELQDLITLVMVNASVEVGEGLALSPLSSLQSLDIRGNPLRVYDKEMLAGLGELMELRTDETKLCCRYFHPSVAWCRAPVDELSSCSDLLGQEFFKAFLWLFALLALLGNAGALVYRVCVLTKTSRSASRVLVKNLCASDLLMGVYMAMIGAADVAYSGVYVEREREWTSSALCTAAGVLCFVSSEVSVLVVCLITLDRVLVLCFPLKARLHVGPDAATAVCGAVWLLGVLLAALPLVTGMRLYGQNAVCVPLPIVRGRWDSGRAYAFSVFVVLNLVLFLLIGVGQVFIYSAIRQSGAATGTKRQQQDATLARRLFLVVLTDFGCCVPIAIMGLLAHGGTPIPGRVNVWTAIFVLPLNSALNPFLYTLNGLIEQRRKRRRQQRTLRMLRKLGSEIPKWPPASVQELMRHCLRSKLVDRDAVLRLLGNSEAPDVPVGVGLVSSQSRSATCLVD